MWSLFANKLSFWVWRGQRPQTSQVLLLTWVMIHCHAILFFTNNFYSFLNVTFNRLHCLKHVMWEEYPRVSTTESSVFIIHCCLCLVSHLSVRICLTRVVDLSDPTQIWLAERNGLFPTSYPTTFSVCPWTTAIFKLSLHFDQLHICKDSWLYLALMADKISQTEI